MAAPLGAVAPGLPAAHLGWTPGVSEQHELELRALEETVAGLREEVEVQRRLVHLTATTYEKELGRIAEEAAASRAAAEKRQKEEVGALRDKVAELEAALAAAAAAEARDQGMLAGTPLARLFSGIQLGTGDLFPKSGSTTTPNPSSSDSTPAASGAPSGDQEATQGSAPGPQGMLFAATHGDLLAMSTKRQQLLAAADRARHEIQRLERSLSARHGDTPAPTVTASVTSTAAAAGSTSPEFGAFSFADFESSYPFTATQDWDPLTLALPLQPEDPLGYTGGLPGGPSLPAPLGPGFPGMPEAYQRGAVLGLQQRPGTAGSVSSSMRLSAHAAVSQSAWRRPGGGAPKAVPKAVQRQRELMQGQWGARIAELQRKLAEKDRVVHHLGALLKHKIALLWQEVAKKDQVIAHLADLARERAVQDSLEAEEGDEGGTGNANGAPPRAHSGTPGAPSAAGVSPGSGVPSSSGVGSGGQQGVERTEELLRKVVQSVGRLKGLAADSAANAERAMDEALSHGHAVQQMLNGTINQKQNQTQSQTQTQNPAAGAAPASASSALPLLSPAASTNLTNAPSAAPPGPGARQSQAAAQSQTQNQNQNTKENQPQGPASGAPTVTAASSKQPQLAAQDSFAFQTVARVIEGEVPATPSVHQRKEAKGAVDSDTPGAPTGSPGTQPEPGASLAPVRVGAPSRGEIVPVEGKGPSGTGVPQTPQTPPTPQTPQTPQSASGIPSVSTPGAASFSRPDSPASRASLPLGGTRFSLWWQPTGDGAPSGQGGASQDPRGGAVRITRVSTETAASRYARAGGGGASWTPSPTHNIDRPVSRGVSRKYTASKRNY